MPNLSHAIVNICLPRQLPCSIYLVYLRGKHSLDLPETLTGIFTSSVASPCCGRALMLRGVDASVLMRIINDRRTGASDQAIAAAKSQFDYA